MDKHGANIQDSFLNSARKEKPHHHLPVERVKLTGRIRSFDKYSRCARRQRPGAADFKARHLHAGHAEIAW